MQRGSVLPILLILILLGTLGVGVYFLQTSKTSTNSEASETIKPVLVKPSPSPTDTSVSIDSVGLNLIMPSGFNLVKETEEGYFKRANGNIRKNFAYYVQYQPPEFEDSFYILSQGETDLNKSVISAVVYKNPSNLDSMNFYKKYWYYPFVWGDFTSRSGEVAPSYPETIGGKTGGSSVVEYRAGKPRFIYLPVNEKNLILQIQLPTEENAAGQKILDSFTFK